MNNSDFIPLVREITAYNTKPSDAIKDIMLMGDNLMAIVTLTEYKFLPNFFDDSGNILQDSLESYFTNYKKYVFQYNEIVKVQIIREPKEYYANHKHSICIEYRSNDKINAVAFYVFEKGFDIFIRSLKSKVDERLIEFRFDFTTIKLQSRTRFIKYEFVIVILVSIVSYYLFMNLPEFNYEDINKSGYPLLAMLKNIIKFIINISEKGLVFFIIFVVILFIALNYIIIKVNNFFLFYLRDRETGVNVLVNRAKLADKLKFQTQRIFQLISEKIRESKVNKIYDSTLESLVPLFGYFLQLIGILFVSIIYFKSCTSIFKEQIETEVLDWSDKLTLACGPLLTYIGYHLKIKKGNQTILNSGNNVLYLRSFKDDGLHTFNRDSITSGLLGLDLPHTAKYLFSLNWLKIPNKPTWLHLEWLWLFHPVTFMRMLAYNRMYTSEEQLSSYFKEIYNEVLAVGKPGESLISTGSTRIYFPDEIWKDEVKKTIISDKTRLIVIQPNIIEWAHLDISSHLDEKTINLSKNNLLNDSIKFEIETAFENRDANEILLCFVNTRNESQIYESFKYWFDNDFIVNGKFKHTTIKKLPVKMPDEHFISFDKSGNAYTLKSFYLSPFIWPFKGTSFNFNKTLKPLWDFNFKNSQSNKINWSSIFLAAFLWIYLIFSAVNYTGKLLSTIYPSSKESNSGIIEIDSYSKLTPIFIEEGDRVSLRATGSVVLGWWVGKGGPDGIDGYTRYNRVIGFKHGCLLGKIGESEWFLIGSGNSFTAKTDGQLQLQINDNEPENNNGGFTVQYQIDN